MKTEINAPTGSTVAVCTCIRVRDKERESCIEQYLFLFCRCIEAAQMLVVSTALLVDKLQLVSCLRFQKSLSSSVFVPKHV